MPVIRAAKTIEQPVSRELTAAEARAIEAMLWKSKGEKCFLHEGDRGKEKPVFTLTPVDEWHALLSTLCCQGTYLDYYALWLAN